MTTAALALAALLLAPAAEAAPTDDPATVEAPADTTLLPSKWSLEKAAPKGRTAAAKAQDARRAQAARRAKAKPRVFGAATASNRGRYSKPQAKVGVAVPF
jgi:hypothetical protein